MQCEICGKYYKRSCNYYRHIALCRLAATAESDDLGDLPTYNELYRMVVGMQREYATLKKEVASLKAITKSKRSITYIEWLKSNRIPHLTFEKWAGVLSLGEAQFDTMTSSPNFGKCLTFIIKDLSHHHDPLPFVGFDGRPNTLYSYGDDGWIECSDHLINSIINQVFKELRRLLGIWENKNQPCLCRDEYERQYAKHVKTIMGPSVGHQELCRIFRRSLYDAAKLTLRNIIEYEFIT